MNSRSDNDSSTDRRQFSRITFDGRTLLSQGAQQWQVTLIDLSLKGLLVEAPTAWNCDTQMPFAATIILGDNTPIHMSLHWRHSEGQLCGLECTHIDIDSITHLRRLVELNLGDTKLLERELAALGK